MSSAPQQQGSPSSAAGMLVVRVQEVLNAKIPSHLASLGANHAEAQPYCVIEVDKNEVIANARDWNLKDRQITWNHRANFDVSRSCEVNISVYIRMPPVSGVPSDDVFVGIAKTKPDMSADKITETSLQLLSNEGIEAGKLNVQLAFKRTQGNRPLNIDEFELLKVIGKGSFGKVMQVCKKDTKRIYAMKIIKKAHIVERAEVSHTLAERAVLAQLNHPFIVPLKFSFQSPEKLYLVLAFVNGGELFHHLQREGRFSEDRAKFYSAQLLCALECLHSYNIIYRDLKPENILLDFQGNIALCDFGLCKLNMRDGNKTNTFCGTPEYLAPELLLGQGYNKTVDWWTFGILVFEMLTGLPPFYDENTNEMYKRILTDELRIPDHVSPVARDMLKKLLDRDPAKRLGAEGAEAIKKHDFFNEISWSKLLAKKYTAPFRPNVSSAKDTSNFDEEFTSEAPVDSVVEGSKLSESIQQQFAGFTYQGPEVIGSVAAGSLLSSSIMRKH